MARVNGITQFLPATHTTILHKHSPDGTTRMKQYTSDIAYYSIYWPRKDERLSWPRWLTYSGQFTRIAIGCRSNVKQGKFAGQRPTFYHCATQPTNKPSQQRPGNSMQW